MTLKAWSGLVALPLLAGVATAGPLPNLSKINIPAKTLKKIQEQTLVSSIGEKTGEIQKLTDDARRITASIGELATKSVGRDDTVAVMQDLVDELKEINKRLDKLTDEVEGLKGWVEGQNEALPIMAFDISELKRARLTNYMQFQYRDSSAKSGGLSAGRGKQDAFAFRRIRIGNQLTVDPKTRIRLSFDGATGGANTAFELRDAILEYDIVPSDVRDGTMVSAGQQALPLGYELRRSSGDREFPERVTYNRVFFDGERNRSVNLMHGLSDSSTVIVGLGSSLTFNDGEQRGIGASPGGRMAGYAQLRNHGTNYDIGIGHFQGDRPAVTTGSGSTAVVHPEISRRFWYIDGALIDVLGTGLTLRGEAMVGHDRRPVDRTATSGLPTSPRLAADVSGYQVQLGYDISSRNQFFVRYGVTDFNTDTDFNSVREYGLAYRYYINPGASVTLAYEIFEDQGATNVAGRNDRKYTVLTARMQYRF